MSKKGDSEGSPFLFCVIMAKTETTKKTCPIKPWKNRDETLVFNEDQSIFDLVPDMPDVVKLMPQNHMMAATRLRLGNEQRGEIEQVYPQREIGVWTQSLKFGVNGPNGFSKVCAFTSVNQDGPVPLELIFNGDVAGGACYLYKSRPEDVVKYFAVMVDPFNADNVLTKQSTEDIEYNPPPNGITAYYVVDEQKLVDEKAKLLQQADNVRIQLSQLAESLDDYYALCQTVDERNVYNGPKNFSAMRVFLNSYVDAQPDKVMSAIKSLDVSRVVRAVTAALDSGFIRKNKSDDGFEFKDGTGILGYDKGISDEQKLKELAKTLMKDSYAAMKQKILSGATSI